MKQSITRNFDRLAFLDPVARKPLQDLLVELFDNKPSVFDVLISRRISVETRSSFDWEIELPIQVIWAEFNVWVEPIKLQVNINRKGDIMFTHFWCDDFPTKDRLKGLSQESSLWVNLYPDGFQH